MNTPEMKWYVLFVKQGFEKKVVEFLLRKKIESFCPLNSTDSALPDWRKSPEQPLFKSFVFVRLVQCSNLDLKKPDAIINFVYWLDKPAIIPDEEIRLIKRFANDYRNILSEKIPVDRDGEAKIVKGTFLKRGPEVQEINNKDIKMILPSLGYALFAKTKKDYPLLLTVSGGDKVKTKKEISESI